MVYTLYGGQQFIFLAFGFIAQAVITRFQKFCGETVSVTRVISLEMSYDLAKNQVHFF